MFWPSASNWLYVHLFLKKLSIKKELYTTAANSWLIWGLTSTSKLVFFDEFIKCRNKPISSFLPPVLCCGAHLFVTPARHISPSSFPNFLVQSPNTWSTYPNQHHLRRPSSITCGCWKHGSDDEHNIWTAIESAATSRSRCVILGRLNITDVEA